MKVNTRPNPVDLRKAKKAMQDLKGFDKKGLSDEIKKSIMKMDMQAKRHVTIAEKNGGNLKRSIAYGARGKVAFLEATAHYAPYVEFGTGGSFSPAELEELGISSDYAAQFKGRSQDRVHLPARPFLFKAVNEVLPDMYANILERLNKIYKK